MYTLYYHTGAASLPVHWLLVELGVPHSLVHIDLEKQQHKSAEYLKVNPTGMIPALVVDGTPRAEVAALLLLLADRHTHPRFAPGIEDPSRPEYLQWMFYLANTVQPAFRAWFYPNDLGGESHAAIVKEQGRKMIEGVWARLDAHLAKQTYLVGNSVTAVDFLAVTLMRWSRNMPTPATKWSHIKSYADRMVAMPSFQTVKRIEGMEEWVF